MNAKHTLLKRETADLLTKIADRYDDLVADDSIMDLARASLKLSHKFLDASLESGRGVVEDKQREVLEPPAPVDTSVGERKTFADISFPPRPALILPPRHLVEQRSDSTKKLFGAQHNKVVDRPQRQVVVPPRLDPSSPSKITSVPSFDAGVATTKQDFVKKCAVYKRVVEPHVTYGEMAKKHEIPKSTLRRCIEKNCAISYVAWLVNEIADKLAAAHIDHDSDGRLVRETLGFSSPDSETESSDEESDEQPGTGALLATDEKFTDEEVWARVSQELTPDKRYTVRVLYEDLVRPHVPDELLNRAFNYRSDTLRSYLNHRAGHCNKWTKSPLDEPIRFLLQCQHRGASPERLRELARRWVDDHMRTSASRFSVLFLTATRRQTGETRCRVGACCRRRHTTTQAKARVDYRGTAFGHFVVGQRRRRRTHAQACAYSRSLECVEQREIFAC